jgi:anti-sigma-K factor RskA
VISRCLQSSEVGAYVLRALSDEEADRFAAHLKGCDECSAAVAQLQTVADALPIGVAQTAPPPELKTRIMDVVNADAELLAPARPAARPARRSWWRSPGFGLAAACAVVAIAAGGLVLSGGDDGSRTVQATSSIGADARLVVDGGEGTLVLDKMPPAPAGKVYQVWLKRGNGLPEPTHTLFTVRRDGRAHVRIEESVKGVDRVLVTAEPDGGSTTPTSEPVIDSATA